MSNFAWKLRFADSIDFLLPFEENCCLSKLMMSMLLINYSALSGLKNFKVAILTWETKNVENHRKSLKTANCKHCRMRLTLKLNNSRINWMWHEKLSPHVWNPWERSRRWEKWVPHELNERQQENRKTTCEMLLARYKRNSFLHRIVTGDEKWIYFENPKYKKSWVIPGEPLTSTAKTNCYGRKTMLCVWWDQKDVIYYELLLGNFASAVFLYGFSGKWWSK